MTTKTFRLRLLFLSISTILLLAAFPGRLHAQACSPVAGNNLIYNSSCSGAYQFGSSAIVDVNAATTSGDICARINSVLTGSTFRAGSVADARGVAPSVTPSTFYCATNPFASGTSTTKPAIVLLPAGTINLCTAWTIPTITQVIGEGPGITVLQAGSGNCTSFADPYASNTGSFTVNPSVIHMGLPTYGSTTGTIAFAVQLRNVTVDGNRQSISGTNIDGIDNNNAEEQSFVDDTTIQNVLGNGLYLSDDPSGASKGAADHSGPYTNIVFQQTGGQLAKTGTVCVKIDGNATGAAQPRGIHGISCLGDASSTPTTAIVLNGNSVSIEDARIDGFITGITVGPANEGTEADILSNIVGTNSLYTGGVADLITIESTATAPLNIAIMGASLTPKATTINDLSTSTTITDQYVGMYTLGAPLGSAITDGYSRLSTSQNSATWIVGYNNTTAISGSCTNGSLFSSTSGGASGTLWACTASAWSLVK